MKVRCNKADICEQQCGAKEPHNSDFCEECPFDKTARCEPVEEIPVETV